MSYSNITSHRPPVYFQYLESHDFPLRLFNKLLVEVLKVLYVPI
jgi:hypothetical protein